jgi:branched-chain amino acid transport system ATP-binding protein
LTAPQQEAANGVDELHASDVKVHFAGVKAVDGVTLDLRRREILGLIGPNGAGKTTFINAVSGFERLTAGRVVVKGRDATKWPPHRLARLGIARTFQNVRLFGRLTVAENVEGGVLGMRLRRAERRERVAQALETLNLGSIAGTRASSLPSGTAKLVAFARAIASRPTFLLLDEPAAGLNEEESDELVETIFVTRDTLECGILVVEHDMRVIMRSCDRVQVLNYGQTLTTGTPSEVRTDRAVREAYLGV